MTEEFLAQAEARVAEGQTQIAAQISHIRRLSDRGYGISEALDLLRTLEQTQIGYVEHRNRLKRKLISMAH